MAFAISKSQLVSSVKRAEALQTRAKRVMARAEVVVKEAVSTLEVGGSAFVHGLIDGRYGGVEVVGVPLPLLTAGGMHVLAFMGVGGALAPHLHQFGNGALASYMTTMGRGAGIAWKEKIAKGGDKAISAGDSLSPEERARLGQ